MSRLDETNLLSPITFNENETSKFLLDHYCGLCESWLVALPAPDSKYYIHCPIHGNLIGSSIISKYQREQAEESRYIGRREMRNPSGKSPEDLIKELGF